MILNMEDRSLKYIINGKDYGYSHDPGTIEEGTYSMACQLYTKPNRVELVI